MPISTARDLPALKPSKKQGILAFKMSQNQDHADHAIAFFAAGCFWGVEETFQNYSGVRATEVGYMGGQTDNPSYEEVCSGRTGHAETVKISFDPRQLSYDDLLQIFWTCHDPTQLNRQGLDIGTQYRSAIFCAERAHWAAAEAAKQRLIDKGVAIVTQISPPPAPHFFAAEAYHQNYLKRQRA